AKCFMRYAHLQSMTTRRVSTEPTCIVIPAEAGIQHFCPPPNLDTGFHRYDGPRPSRSRWTPAFHFQRSERRSRRFQKFLACNLLVRALRDLGGEICAPVSGYAFASLVSLIFPFLSTANAAQPATKLFVAYGSVSSNASPLWIAQEQGFFNKYGMDAESVFIIGGRAIQAMVAGQVEVGFIGPVHVTNAVTAGGDLTMILGLRNKFNTIFVARPSIKSAEQLKGKKIATGTPGGPVSLAVYLVLDYFGLNSQRDKIVLLQVGGTAERLAALRAGSVEATSLPPELARVLISEGYNVLLDTEKEDIPF